MPSVWRIYNNEIGENRAKISNNNVILASERVCYRDIKKKGGFTSPSVPTRIRETCTKMWTTGIRPTLRYIRLRLSSLNDEFLKLLHQMEHKPSGEKFSDVVGICKSRGLALLRGKLSPRWVTSLSSAPIQQLGRKSCFYEAFNVRSVDSA